MSDKRGPIERAFDAAQSDRGGCKHMNASIAQSLPPASQVGRAAMGARMYEIPEDILAGARKVVTEPHPNDILKDLPKEPADKTNYAAYLKKTALVTMSLEARLPDETTRLLSANFEEADEAMSLFFGYMVACGFHPGSVTRAMREFLDSCDE